MSSHVIQHAGRSFPLGATLVRAGTNFSVFAKGSRAVQLLLFDSADAPALSRVIDLDPRRNRTYHYWHTFVPGVAAGQVYAYRALGTVRSGTGPAFRPEQGAARSLREMHRSAGGRTGRRSTKPGRQRGDRAQERGG